MPKDTTQPISAMAERIELWPAERLQPYAKNARTHSDDQVDQIAASMREFGFTNPILVDSADGIIAGHGRLMAAKRLGLATVPVIVLDHLTDAQRRAYILADNKLALNAGWDNDLLAQELEQLHAEGFDLELTGFTDDELADLIADNDNIEQVPEGDPEQVPEPQPDPVSVTGDVWVLGKHRVMCGDSTSIDAVDRLMAGGKADMVFTDPPYNVAYKGKTKDALTIENDEMSDSDFRDFLVSALGSAYAAMGEGSPIYVCGPLEDGNFIGAFHQSGLKLQSILIWLKNSIVIGRKDYHYKHEPIIYGWKEGAAHKWFGDRDKSTVFACNKPPRNGEHPTMKPVELVEYYIQNSSKTKNSVLDLFGGSGSTLIACEKTNRQARLMELDPRYVDVIIKRWQDFTGKRATLEGDGRTFDELAAERVPAAA